MIWLIVMIIILIIAIIGIWWWQTNNKNQEKENGEIPTIHSRCDGKCGGDLICDKTCSRCKKEIGGDCSSNVDCRTGLVCHQWKCLPYHPSFSISQSQESSNTESRNVSEQDKHIRWNESNETFVI